MAEETRKSPLFHAIDKGETETALNLLKTKEDATEKDSAGMSALSAAAYRGNLEVLERCLELGCDVNDKTNDNGYTPLMFAALSGKANICKILMDHGARSYTVNGIGKTASELAAFIGHHECVSVINNHLTIEEIETFLRPKSCQKVEEEETYPDDLAEFIHGICSSHEVHPVRLVFKLSKYQDSMKYKKKILYVVDRVFEKQLRCRESNEVMSLKMWIILFTLREILKFIEAHPDKNQEEACLLYGKMILLWAVGEEVRKPLDVVLRNAVAAFPYKHSLLHDTLNKALDKSPIGQRPTAFDFIVQGLFGQRILAVSQFCSVCGAVNAKKRCPKCKLNYCSTDCQKFDWEIHRKVCNSLNLPSRDMEQQQGLSIEDIQAQIGGMTVQE